LQIDIRPISAEEVVPWVHGEHRAFGDGASEAYIQAWGRLLDPALTLAARDGFEIVGGAAWASLELTVPGSSVPMAAVTSVWVAPTHRRRGVMRALMRRQLDDVHESGQPVAGLHASEGSIYGRFGYGMAAYQCGVKIDRRHAAFARPAGRAGRLRLLSRTEALETLPAVWERVRLHRPGMPGRPRSWWEFTFRETSREDDDRPGRVFVVSESEDGVDGYLIYRFRDRWVGASPRGTVEVEELLTASTEAYAFLWRYCLDMDLTTRTQAHNRPIDEPLLLMLAEPRRLRLTVSDGLWVRLVDVPKALAARRYPVEGRLVLEVADEFCPWNTGRFELEGGPEGASCRRSRRSPDLGLQADDLACAYLGGIPFRSLQGAGRTIERRKDALTRADAMFSWHPQPWCPLDF
jgi:predicted acetyltransferase